MPKKYRIPKLFNAILENVMRKIEWKDMEMKVDGRLCAISASLTKSCSSHRE